MMDKSYTNAEVIEIIVEQWPECEVLSEQELEHFEQQLDAGVLIGDVDRAMVRQADSKGRSHV